MRTIDVIVIGAGQAGLATSRCLTRRGIEHCVIERGSVGDAWRARTWDSLRLLTPNWLNALPGLANTREDRDGFMTRDAFLTYLDDYSATFRAPLMTRTRVLAVSAVGDAYRVDTDRGAFRARAVVIATGHCDLPALPPAAATLDPRLESLHASAYRNPSALPMGGVLVVGASASGIQIARELRLAGRDVAIAVGRHTRLPRLHRDRDIFYWLDRVGLLSQPVEAMPDPAAAYRQPSLQLAGRPDRGNTDLAVLQALGVRLLGRLCAVDGHHATFGSGLEATLAAADQKLRRLLDDIDRHAGRLAVSTDPPIAPVVVPADGGAVQVGLLEAGIRTIVWATGYRRAYPWLRLPVLDEAGEIVHRGGATALPGLHAIGLRMLRRRNSSFIGGVGPDAEALAEEIALHLGHRVRRVA